MFDPFKRFQFIYQFSEMYKTEMKTLETLHNFTNSVIVSRRNDLANSSQTDSQKTDDNDVGAKKKIAFLDLLLQSTIDGKALKNEDIREEVDTFMFEVS